MNNKEKDRLLQNLPACAAEFIKLVIKKMRYRRKVRAEVMVELAAHFEDELKDCRSDSEKEQKAQKLIEDFGDAKLLGILLRRAKKRCRPLWRTVVARTFQTIGILILCFIVYVVWFLTGKPIITTDYIAELNRIVRPVADESLNAAPLYEKAVALYNEKVSGEITEHQLLPIFGTASRYNEVTVEQKKIIAKWLEDNKEIFDLVKAGTQKPYCWQKYQDKGEIGGLIDSLMLPLDVFRKIAFCLRWRAHTYAKEGRYEEAFDDIKSCYRFGRHQKGDKGIVEQFVGISIEGIAVQTIREILSDYEIDSSTLTGLQKNFEEIIAAEDFVIGLKAEKLLMYDEIQRCFTEDRIGGGHIHISREGLKRLQILGALSSYSPDPSSFMKVCSKFLNILFTHPNKQQSRETADRYFEYSKTILHKNPAQLRAEGIDLEKETMEIFKGNILLEILGIVPGRANIICYRYKTYIDSALAIIAILRYRQDKGDFPESLDELIITGYLKELPMDPWSDKPLIYKRTEDNFILYSVGYNFIDDGGEYGKDEKGKPNLWAEEGDAVFWPVIK